jgi:hypothetical protein
MCKRSFYRSDHLALHSKKHKNSAVVPNATMTNVGLVGNSVFGGTTPPVPPVSVRTGATTNTTKKTANKTMNSTNDGV